MFKDNKANRCGSLFLLFSLDNITPSVYTKSVGNGR